MKGKKNGINLEQDGGDTKKEISSGRQAGADIGHRRWYGRNSYGIFSEKGRRGCCGGGCRKDCRRADEEHHGKDYGPAWPDLPQADTEGREGKGP